MWIACVQWGVAIDCTRWLVGGLRTIDGDCLCLRLLLMGGCVVSMSVLEGCAVKLLVVRGGQG